MIGDTTESWTYTVEMQIRDWDGKPTWTRTPGIEVTEQTARDMYRQAIRDGLPAHLRAPRLTHVVRTIIDEQPTIVNCPRGGQCPPDCPRTIHTGCRHLQEHQ
ncbi:hypothetical protein A5721_18855 [Mycobacterium vulneris]|nr:hypothetical protein A5721_18855 [Mycolicibacterium vulneris]